MSSSHPNPTRIAPPKMKTYDVRLVKTLFDAGAADYDRHRRRVIPCFDDFYAALVAQAPFAPGDDFTGLDLGAGTGLVSALLLEAFPKARMVLIDVSEAMLVKARERFAGDDRVAFVVRDYTAGALPDSYDLVASAMSIHHLCDADKQRLYETIFAALNPGGLFVNADLILGASKAEEAMWQRNWRDHLAVAGFSHTELAAMVERMALDRPAPLDDQLEWIATAGFETVACVYQNANFGVLTGTRPVTESQTNRKHDDKKCCL